MSDQIETIRQIILKLKIYINNNDFENFSNFLIYNFDFLKENVDLSYIFQKVYLHACLKKNRHIAEWLRKECFAYLNPFEQMSIRQVFAYGNHLLSN